MRRGEDSWLTEDLMMKVRRYARRINVARICFVDVHDIEQDLLCEVCEAIKFFDGKRGNMSAFVESVLSNRSKNYLRNRFAAKRGGNIFFEPFEESDKLGKQLVELNNDPEQELIKKIDLARAEKSLSLFQLQLYIFLKRHSIADISNSLNIPYASLHFEAQKIRECIKDAINSQKTLGNGEYRYWRGVNMKNISILETLSAKEISSLEIGDLMELNEQIVNLNSHVKEIKEKLEDGLNLKFLEAVKNSLRCENKDTGTTRFYDGMFQIVAEVPKKVTWDQEKMEELVKRVPDERRKSMVKITYTIEERKYAELPREYQELFREARTITPGKTKFQISIGEQS